MRSTLPLLCGLGASMPCLPRAYRVAGAVSCTSDERCPMSNFTVAHRQGAVFSNIPVLVTIALGAWDRYGATSGHHTKQVELVFGVLLLGAGRCLVCRKPPSHRTGGQALTARCRPRTHPRTGREQRLVLSAVPRRPDPAGARDACHDSGWRAFALLPCLRLQQGVHCCSAAPIPDLG